MATRRPRQRQTGPIEQIKKPVVDDLVVAAARESRRRTRTGGQLPKVGYNKTYSDNYDAIFGKKPKTDPDGCLTREDGECISDGPCMHTQEPKEDGSEPSATDAD